MTGGVVRVPMAMDAVGVTVMPVGMQVECVGVPVMPVGVPRMVVRRGVGMGDREERHERAEREPRDRIPAAMPVPVPAPRLRGAGKGQHGRENEHRQPHRASSRTEAPGRAPADVRNVHYTPSGSAASHSELPPAGVKPGTGVREDEVGGSPAHLPNRRT